MKTTLKVRQWIYHRSVKKFVLHDRRLLEFLINFSFLLGYRVGYALSERLSKENGRYRDELETVKYLCKELWFSLFKKQVDNLRTNHQGVYVIHDNYFRPLQQNFLSSKKPMDPEDRIHSLFVAFSAGLIRGILTNLGFPCNVTSELADFGVRFQIEINPTIK